jgi:DNA repair exonuclease SbcCD ATPase subunit
MKRLSSFLAFTFILTLAGATFSNTQQTEVRKRTPRLTTDDVTSRPSQTTETPVVTTEESAKKAGEALKSDSGKPTSTKAAGATKGDAGKTSADEQTWREQLAKARERAESLERTAEEAELRTTSLRNDLGASGQDTRQRNATAADLESAGQQLTEAKSQARAANAELKRLLDEGNSKGFAEAQGPKATSADGKANVAYYKGRYDKLLQTLRDAERRVQLYDNRVRSLNESLVNTNRDRFTSAQLEQDRNEAQDKADEARATLSKAQTDLESLMNEARAAGVPPGLFR